MKTTIEIPDPLFKQVQTYARKTDKTMKEIMETALRSFLKGQSEKPKPFQLRDASFKGDGLMPGIEEGDWDTIRSMIYEGRGG